MILYRPIETHSHTIHSDGRFTPEELLQAAKERGLAGVVVSDHNTQSAFDSISRELQCKTTEAIYAIEWTTYFGHMVVIGGNAFVDWRFATPDDIDAHIAKIREGGGVVGIAHPFEEGDPICTGCFWMFRVTNWENVNYIEVWSTEDPILKYKNIRAFEWWTTLLNKGHRLAATAGTDWHKKSSPRQLAAVTYVGVEAGAVNTQTVALALEQGRTFVTMGPTIDLCVHQHGRTAQIGDTIAAGDAKMEIHVHASDRRDIWQPFGCEVTAIGIIHNGETVQRLPINNGEAFEERLVSLSKGWMRVELYGAIYHELDNALLAFTSPIYVE